MLGLGQMKMDTDKTPKQRRVLYLPLSFSFCLLPFPCFPLVLTLVAYFSCMTSSFKNVFHLPAINGKSELFIPAQSPPYAGATSSRYEEWKRVCAEYLLQDFADGDGAQKCTSVIRGRKRQLHSKRFISRVQGERITHRDWEIRY